MLNPAKKSILSDVPPWALALIASVLTFILMFLLAGIVGSVKIFKDDQGEVLAYIFYGIVVSVCCFFISTHSPHSFWYIPLICNFPCFIAAMVEPTFWTTILGFLLGGSLVLSFIGAFAGRRYALPEHD